jgi:hypothetical protein
MLDRVRALEASRAEQIDHAATEVLDLTRRSAEAQREVMTSVRAMLQVMARAYVAMLARGDTCNLYMHDLVGNMPWVKGMAIIGPDGRIKCATRATAVGLDVSDRPHYQDAVRTRDFAVSDYLIGRATRTQSRFDRQTAPVNGRLTQLFVAG